MPKEREKKKKKGRKTGRNRRLISEEATFECSSASWGEVILDSDSVEEESQSIVSMRMITNGIVLIEVLKSIRAVMQGLRSLRVL